MTHRRLKEMTRPTTLLLKIPPLLLLKILLLLLLKILLLLLMEIPLKIRLQATMVLRVKAMETTHPQPEPWSRLPSSSSCSRGSSKLYRISGNEIIRKLFARGLIWIHLNREGYFRSPSPQTSSKILLNSTGYLATRPSGTFCE